MSNFQPPLTRRVLLHSHASWQGEETSSIPLQAIAFTRIAWQRRWGWLLAAIAAAALGFLAPDLFAWAEAQPMPWTSWVMWVGAVAFALVYVLYKPGKIMISSAHDTLSGRPASTDEAAEFLDEVIRTLPDLREVVQSRP